MILKLLIIIHLFLVANTTLAGFFYTNKIFTNQEYSYGLKHNSSIFFISSYHAYRKPKGLARFPDGGRVKTVYEEISLFRFNITNNSLKKIAIISTKIEFGTNIKGSKLKFDSNILYLSYRCNNNIKRPDKIQCIYDYDFHKEIGRFLEGQNAQHVERTIFKDYWDIYRDKLIRISTLKKKYLKEINYIEWEWGFNHSE